MVTWVSCPVGVYYCWKAALCLVLDLQVLLSEMICVANVHGDKACPKRAFAITLKEDSASNIVALSWWTFLNVLHLDQGSPRYRGLRVLHGSADGASLGASGDGGGPGIKPSWR
eukprot:1154334-Pelagomonas_calceolata.AAC.2